MSTRITIAGWDGCGFHAKAAQAAKGLEAKFPGKFTVEVNTMPRDAFRGWVSDKSAAMSVNHTTSPFVTVGDSFLGGCDDTLAYIAKAEKDQSGYKTVDDAEPEEHNYDFDLIVIGGGSGGMAASKAAADLLTPGGMDSGIPPRVCCLDFVKPSPIGTKWGFGGTCVNVGCIPKKLYHTAAITRDTIVHSPYFGAEESLSKPPPANWETVRQNIQMHIKSLNFGSVSELRTGNVKYKNALGRFVDPHTIECTNRKGEKENITGRRILLAMGGRPNYPDIPGAKEFGITSDDIFSLSEAPGETLVVGASYIALECAGFLTGLGYKTTVLMRSIPLRGFDQQMAEVIVNHMEAEGTAFIKGATPTEVTKGADGKLTVKLSNGGTHVCDNVLFAVGRAPDASINLEAAGVKTHDRSGKIITDAGERTSAPHVYAIGDVIEGGLELTPVAIQSGRLLAQRLYNSKTKLMDYSNIATTVFTPLEYGVCGFSEEEATEKFKNIEVYHSYFTPLEWTVPQKPTNTCYIKIITDLDANERVIGFHICCPNAGEVLQGVAVAMRAGATKQHFDDTVGIHPTVAEMMTTLTTTKSSGVSAEQAGC